jgi:hypothetical protein
MEMGGLCEFPHFTMLGVSITLEGIVSNVWGCGNLRIRALSIQLTLMASFVERACNANCGEIRTFLGI